MDLSHIGDEIGWWNDIKESIELKFGEARLGEGLILI